MSNFYRCGGSISILYDFFFHTFEVPMSFKLETGSSSCSTYWLGREKQLHSPRDRTNVDVMDTLFYAGEKHSYLVQDCLLGFCVI